MEFGKLSDISRVDFSLPEDADRTQRILTESAAQSQTKIYIGMARWGERKLVGKLYPKGTTSKDYLYQYARQFSTIEMNTTHYRIPTTDMVEQWKEKTPVHFKFCPKLPQVISHSSDFGEGIRATHLFLEALRAFEDQLGLAFLQLPPTLEPRHDGKALFDYLSNWPGEIPLAIELRHPAWFENSRIRERAFDLLEENNMSTVITDTAGRRDVIHMQLTNPKLMVRFVGNALHPTDYQRIDQWVSCIGNWVEQGLQELYFIVHQPEDTLCIDLAIYLVDHLNKRLKMNLRPPRIMQGGIQKTLF
ncbi:uncharacterized protein YecE (DUF72 family) [Catalinimonas alkaloidigena]|uniref:DUF72 domain-containing protein n=1 Tax=Catalinimonas alkaloidigena TaxID=1075417 RepID=UPI002405DA50|nr:DUF72 domain-containing protein [Catalinimonas alkaloidigena]MDF9795907.1 uncharacterized protein YecE (DUF72 family) [Catalinimonas alkaloidigena]